MPFDYDRFVKELIAKEEEWEKKFARHEVPVTLGEPRLGTRGFFFNVCGCHWVGTKGAAVWITQRSSSDAKKTNLQYSTAEVRNNISKNFQIIVKVPIRDEQVNQGNLELYEVYTVNPA